MEKLVVRSTEIAAINESLSNLASGADVTSSNLENGIEFTATYKA
jgi:hypothetical protein